MPGAFRYWLIAPQIAVADEHSPATVERENRLPMVMD